MLFLLLDMATSVLEEEPRHKRTYIKPRQVVGFFVSRHLGWWDVILLCMRKLYLLLPILFLIYWGCEDSKEEDTTPTEVTLWGVVYSVEDTDSLPNLPYSGLTGSIPSEIGNLTNLTELNLYGNQLTGSIPPEIGNLTNLTYMNLGSNQLTGSIPSEIGSLTNLFAFVVGNNQLTGIIPDEICNQGDSSPHLENNQLCPPYPSCIEDYVGEQDTSDCP